ncbi:hypothetical protein [Streptomyces sp. E-08]|uniref:hypothetical protein n=1 Tax=Streptomyces sp. E-08 TaxID=3404047 RepID=UPI003CED1C1B
MTTTSPDPDALHGLLRELTRFMPAFSGEGAEGVARVVRGIARTYGGRAETVVVADGAVLSVTAGAAPSPRP